MNAVHFLFVCMWHMCGHVAFHCTILCCKMNLIEEVLMISGL